MSDITICVVGHGPSLIDQKKGAAIDEFDLVVRLKGCGPLIRDHAEDYGARVDALCMTTEVPGLVFDVVAGQYWFYPKNGNYDEVRTFDVVAKRGAPFMIPLDLVNHWNRRFREEIGSSFPNISTGVAAAIIAAHYYEPAMIVLAGFDTVLDPQKAFDRHPDVPRTGVGEIRHDWQSENALLHLVAKAYDTQIVSIFDVEKA